MIGFILALLAAIGGGTAAAGAGAAAAGAGAVGAGVGAAAAGAGAAGAGAGAAGAGAAKLGAGASQTGGFNALRGGTGPTQIPGGLDAAGKVNVFDPNPTYNPKLNERFRNPLEPRNTDLPWQGPFKSVADHFKGSEGGKKGMTEKVKEYAKGRVVNALMGGGSAQSALEIMDGEEPQTFDAAISQTPLPKYEAASAAELKSQTEANEPDSRPIGAANHLIGQFEDASPELRVKMAEFEPKKNYLRAGLSGLFTGGDPFGGFRDSINAQEDEQRKKMIRDHYAEQAREQRVSGERGY